MWTGEFVFMEITDQAVLHVAHVRNTTTENQKQGHKAKWGLLIAMFDWVEVVVSYQIKMVFLKMSVFFYSVPLYQLLNVLFFLPADFKLLLFNAL